MKLQDPEEIMALTPENPFDRFPDGRPHVPDDLIRRMALVTIEEAWGVLRRHGYNHQFEGGWMNIHPDQTLVGRAVTARFVPQRPDLHAVVEERGKAAGCVGGQNSWVIDTLLENDVIVVDLFGKVKDGTFAGDNLSTAIHARSKTGMVVDGGLRDLQRVQQIPDFAIFVRGVDPTAILNVTLAGLNTPIRIGQATVLPGDVVLGTRTGVIFIPPHLAQEVVERSEQIRLRDRFGHQRLREGKYTPGQIDRKWSEEIEADFAEWRKTNE
jgi:regulator of RNase E activity RraA